MSIIKFSEFIKEDAPANVTGGGSVGGTPTMANPDSVLGSTRRTKFAEIDCFDVDDQYYDKCRNGKAKYHKYEKYVGNDETGEEIRKFGRENPKSSILVRNKNTGSMMYLRKVNESIAYDFVDINPELPIKGIMSTNDNSLLKYAGKKLKDILAKFKSSNVNLSKSNAANEYLLELPNGIFLEFTTK